MREVTLYGKPDCHLCAQARDELVRIGRAHPFRLVERDITLEENLHRAYFERIPVIAVDGKDVCDFFVDETALLSALSSQLTAGDDLESEP
jgi:glutaredoxin